MNNDVAGKAVVITGLGFGDEGKGSLVDFLCRELDISLVIRYNGGSQAGHHVVLEDNSYHCFRQVGSGSFTGDVKTYLSSRMYVDPRQLIEEELALKQMGVKNVRSRILIDENAPVIFSFNIVLNRLREAARGGNKVGTVGLGVGDCVRDHIGGRGVCFGELFDREELAKKLSGLAEVKKREAEKIVSKNPSLQHIIEEFQDCFDAVKLAGHYHNFADYFRDRMACGPTLPEGSGVVFEGAQGVLLDPDIGFPPYVTKTSTLSTGALELARGRDAQILGLLRAYAHRHGPGPLPTEIKGPPDLVEELADKYDNKWQGPFRVGWLDMILMKYALAVNPVDVLVMTNLDRLAGFEPRVCISYEYLPQDRSSTAVLDRYFENDIIEDGRHRILGFKAKYLAEPVLANTELTNILMHCRPLGFKEFKGWPRTIYDARTYEDLPLGAVEYLEYIEAETGLKVKVISVGPSHIEKFFAPE